MKYVTKQGFTARTQFRKQSASVNIWSFPLEGQAKFYKTLENYSAFSIHYFMLKST